MYVYDNNSSGVVITLSLGEKILKKLRLDHRSVSIPKFKSKFSFHKCFIEIYKYSKRYILVFDFYFLTVCFTLNIYNIYITKNKHKG